MINFIVRVILFFAVCSFSLADDADDPCNGTSGASAHKCSQSSWDASEQHMQTVYDAAKSHIKEYSPELLQNFISAQKTWLKFRTQYCDVFGTSRVPGNTWTTYWENTCKAKLADHRAAELLPIYDY